VTENVLHVAYVLAIHVKRCDHGQEIIPFPMPDGRVAFVSVLGEAR